MTLVGALAAWVLARSAGVAHELLKVKLWVQGGGSVHLRSAGVRRSGPRSCRRNLGVRFRLIRAVSTRRPGQSCIDPAFWA